MRRFFVFSFWIAVLAVLLAAGSGWWWLNQPMRLAATNDANNATANAALDLEIEPGTSASGAVEAVIRSGVAEPQWLLNTWFRLSGQARLIKAGSYELLPGTTPRRLLSMLVRGEEALKSVTLVEGWNFVQVRAALLKAEQLTPVSAALTPEELMQQLGRTGQHPEGRFFPDTYTYAKGSPDLAVLARAARAMDKRLDAAWQSRSSNSVLTNPEQALILASIVEKETGKAADRAQIAGVFTNRLRIGMLLQTDPTVIYGLGSSFDGNLRKRDLQADTPYNTYTRPGLPPTPIAMPGRAALLAAVQPASTDAIYFVAKGDGSSAFSRTLDEHNRAVNKYIRGLGGTGN